MANVVRFFMGPEDEAAFFRDIASLELELYPAIVPPDWDPPMVEEGLAASLDLPEYYLGIPGAGPITIDKIKRGPNKGQLMILEVISPVIHFDRSSIDHDEKRLQSGRIWAELQVSGDTQRFVQKPPVVERTFAKVSEAIARRARRSQPVGHLILPHAAKLHGQGYELREVGRKGGVVRPFR